MSSRQPVQPGLRAGHGLYRVEQRYQGGADLPAAVVEDGRQLPGQRAPLAQKPAPQQALEAAAVTEEAAGDPGAILADRCPVAAPTWQQPTGAAAGALPVGTGRLVVAGAAAASRVMVPALTAIRSAGVSARSVR